MDRYPLVLLAGGEENRCPCGVLEIPALLRWDFLVHEGLCIIVREGGWATLSWFQASIWCCLTVSHTPRVIHTEFPWPVGGGAALLPYWSGLSSIMSFSSTAT